jgi:uncharacterized damage-inducible protein DinB
LGECMDIADFRRLFAYDSWANREVITSLSAVPSPLRRPLKLMAHILGAEDVWYTRLQGQSPVLGVWPELSAQGCREQEERLHRLWSKYLDEIEPAQPFSAVSYKNSKGESWTSKIDDILLHVVMHSGYHRGQIAGDTRASGHTPAYTDFILAVRQGLIE